MRESEKWNSMEACINSAFGGRNLLIILLLPVQEVSRTLVYEIYAMIDVKQRYKMQFIRSPIWPNIIVYNPTLYNNWSMANNFAECEQPGELLRRNFKQ